MKVYKVAKMPLDLKYDGPDNTNYSLVLFRSLAFHHLEEHSMDSVFCFDYDGMEYNLFMLHPMFTIDEIKVATEVLKDGYDVQNLKWTCQFLLDSLSMKQQLHVSKYAGSGINGPLLWMYVVLEN